jgi:PBSX family phage terminase large subunit
MIVEPLQGKARAAVGHKASLIAFEGSVRSGKTWASLLDWLEFCRRGPRGNLAMVGRTERTVIENLIMPLQQFLGEDRVKLNRGTGIVMLLGRRVRLIGANDEAAVTKIQGPTFAGIYIDEASTIPESFFQMAYSRLSVTGAQMWLTSNPEAPAHWLKVNWLDRARLWIDGAGVEHLNEDSGTDYVRVSFRLEDNAHNLSPAYLERVKAAYTGLWYKRFILGEWTIAAGAVYDMWDPNRHVIHEAPSIARLLSVGIDYGTTNPTRGYLLGITSKQPARLVILDEWKPPQLTDAGLSKHYREWIGNRRPEWVCVDPSAASFKLQLFSDGLSNVMNGHNAVVSGIRTVSSLLASGALVVMDTCTELIRQLPSYSWDPKATAKGEDEPIKAFDHEADAVRYAIASTRQLWGFLVPLNLPSDD